MGLGVTVWKYKDFTHQELKYYLPKGQGEPNYCKLYCIFPDRVVETSHESQPDL